MRFMIITPVQQILGIEDFEPSSTLDPFGGIGMGGDAGAKP